MTGRFSRYQREYIKQLVIESEVQRFSMEETLAHVKDGLKQDVSMVYLYTVKRNI
jgi:RNA:NAD 2'-phosphotransferase (TPT1/KptA family)